MDYLTFYNILSGSGHMCMNYNPVLNAEDRLRLPQLSLGDGTTAGRYKPPGADR